MFAASLDSSLIASLSPTTTETAFSLVATGPAVLSMPTSPFVDTILFRVRVAGKFHLTSGSNRFTPSLYVGNSATLASDQRLGTFGALQTNPTTDNNFFMVADLLWDSVSQNVNGSGLENKQGSSSISLVTLAAGYLSTQSSLQFIVSGVINSTDANATASITQFDIEIPC